MRRYLLITTAVGALDRAEAKFSDGTTASAEILRTCTGK